MDHNIRIHPIENGFSEPALLMLGKASFFLSPEYLLSLKNSLPVNIKAFLCEFYEHNTCVGIAIFQEIKLNHGDAFPNKKNVACSFKNFLNNNIKVKILFLGNNMLTGQYAYHFTENIKDFEIPLLLNAAMEKLSVQQKASILVLKDVFSGEDAHWETPPKYMQFKVQPNMQMPIIWPNMDDYFVSLKKSYRQNLQRTRKHKEGIEVVELSSEELHTHQEKMHELYEYVVQNARFNTINLPISHFYHMKKKLGEKFRVFAYFKNQKMIAFYSMFLQNKKLDSYFLGYDPEFLKTDKLYLNMLLDMLEIGINTQSNQLLMGRTAMEMKSNIGLVPLDYYGYIRHKNPIINYLLPYLFRFFNPKVEWEQRHPFK